jgi:hypothetical protein
MAFILAFLLELYVRLGAARLRRVRDGRLIRLSIDVMLVAGSCPNRGAG